MDQQYRFTSIKILMLMCALSTIGCSSRDLSRSKAKDLVNQQAIFANVRVLSLSAGEDGTYRLGCNEKLWQCGSPTIFPKGAEFVTSFTGPFEVALRQPMKREVIEVTGITDASNAKEKVVEFTWKYTGFPAGFASYLGAGATSAKGKALFLLYDDGWRVQELIH